MNFLAGARMKTGALNLQNDKKATKVTFSVINGLHLGLFLAQSYQMA